MPACGSARPPLTRPADMHPIRTITLDLDDTLWAIAPVIERAERELWRWLGEHYPRVVAHWDASSLAALRQEIVAEHADRAHDLRFLRRTVMARMAREAGYGDELVDPAFAVFDEYRNRVTLFPDVLPGLGRLAGDFRLVALTNGNASLARIGIRHLFDDVVTAVDAGAAKPARRIFDAVCERAGVEPAAVLHVGDHPEIDVAGARAAGLRAAWVNRHGAAWPDELPPPEATVTSLLELADWLAPSPRAADGR